LPDNGSKKDERHESGGPQRARYAAHQVLGFHNARQRVIAENVANANTPGFTPSDISQSQFERVLAGQVASQLGPAHQRSAPFWRRSSPA
jgi:flagellar basal-body rod protein FlgB